MDTRQPFHSDHAKTLDSAGLRGQFLVDTIFVRSQLTLTCSQIDRIIVGGAMPLGEELGFTADLAKQFAVSGGTLARRDVRTAGPLKISGYFFAAGGAAGAWGGAGGAGGASAFQVSRM